MERAEITGKQMVAQGSYRYHVKFWLATSLGITGTQLEAVEIQKINGQYRVDNVQQEAREVINGSKKPG